MQNQARSFFGVSRCRSRSGQRPPVGESCVPSLRSARASRSDGRTGRRRRSSAAISCRSICADSSSCSVPAKIRRKIANAITELTSSDTPDKNKHRIALANSQFIIMRQRGRELGPGDGRQLPQASPKKCVSLCCRDEKTDRSRHVRKNYSARWRKQRPLVSPVPFGWLGSETTAAAGLRPA
jgi:hypothetical protein